MISSCASLGAVTGAVIAGSSSQQRSVTGQAQAIEDANRRIAAAERQLAASGGPGQGPFTEQLEARIAAMKKYRNELQQSMADQAGASNASPVEDARLARHTKETKDLAKNMADLNAVQLRQWGVPDSYLKEMQEIIRLNQSGVLTGKEYTAALAAQQKELLKKTTDYEPAKAAYADKIGGLEREQAEAVAIAQREQAQLDALHKAGQLSDADYYAQRLQLAQNANTDQQAVVELELEAARKSGLAAKEKKEAIQKYEDELLKLRDKALADEQRYQDDVLQLHALKMREHAQIRRAEADGIAQFMETQRQAEHANLAALQQRVDGVQAEIEATALARNQNISLAQAVEKVAVARLRERQAARFVEGSEGWLQVQAEIDKRTELIELMNTKELRDREQSGWADVWQSMDNAAHDVWNNIWQGGSNVLSKLGQMLKVSILDLLYQATARPFLIQIGSSVLGSGFSQAAGAATSAGASVLGSGAGSLMGGGVMLGGASLAAIGSSIGSGFMATLSGQSIGAAASAYSAAGMSGVSAGLQIGAAAPYVLAAVAAASALGLFRQTSTVGGGLRGTLGAGDINAYGLDRKDGYLFGGPQYSVHDQGVAQQSAAIQSSYSQLRENVATMAGALGLGSDAVRHFTTVLGTDIIHPDTGGIGIKLDGLTPEQSAQKINEALAAASEEMARQVLGTWTTTTDTVTRQIARVGAWYDDGTTGFDTISESVTRSAYAASSYAKEGESALQTLTRLSESLVTVNQWADTLGFTLLHGLAGADAASHLADAFGGVQALGTAASDYYAKFYDQQERTATLTRQTTQALSEMGLQMPKSRTEFRAMVEAQIQAGGSGINTAAALIKLSGAMDQLLPQFGNLTAQIDAQTAAAQAFDTQAAARAAAQATANEVQATALQKARTDVDALRGEATSKYLAAARAVTEAQNAVARALREAVQGLRGFLTDLDGATTSPLDSMALAKQRFDATGQRALAGDTTALAELQPTAQKYLDLAEHYSPSASAFRAAQAGVRRVVQGVIDLGESALSKLPAELQRASDPVGDAYAALATAVKAEVDARSAAMAMQAPLTDTTLTLTQRYQNLIRALPNATELQEAFDAVLDMDWNATLTREFSRYVPDMGEAFDMGAAAERQLQRRLAVAVPDMGAPFELQEVTRQVLRNAMDGVVGGVHVTTPGTTPPAVTAQPVTTPTPAPQATPITSGTATAAPLAHDQAMDAVRALVSAVAAGDGGAGWITRVSDIATTSGLSAADLYAATRGIDAKELDLNAQQRWGIQSAGQGTWPVVQPVSQAQPLAAPTTPDEALARYGSLSTDWLRATRDMATQAGGTFYSGGVAISVDQLQQWARNHGVPAFDAGGWHGGGVALVGERGPELLSTGPARIHSAADTRRLIAGDTSAPVVGAVRDLQRVVEQLQRDLLIALAKIAMFERSTADATDRMRVLHESWARNGIKTVAA